MSKNLKSRSLFQLINRKNFDKLVDKWQMDKGVTKFSTWEMTCALLSSFIYRLGSYREISQTLGIAHSTLGDALSKRSFGFFQALCDEVLSQIQLETTSRKVKKAIREVLAIDSSEVRVHGGLFGLPLWRQKKSVGPKAAAKLHVVWNVCGGWVEDFIITPVRKHDSPVSRYLKLLPGKFYVFDRAYNDLSFWYEIQKKGSHFVTRLKNVPRNRYLELSVKSKKSMLCRILFDGTYKPDPSILRLHTEIPKDIHFRHIIYRDPETGKIFHFVTSDFKSSATVIAETYRKRWAVELLFKWLKGHLNVRYLSVKTPNAVKIQLTMAVLVQLLLQLQKIMEAFEGTLWELLRLIRTNLIRQSICHSHPPDGCRWKKAVVADMGT